MMTPSSVDWIARQLACPPHTVTITPFQDSATSTVSRIEARNAVYFLKACKRAFPYEPRLTQHLATQFPQWVPPVVGIEEAHGWLLMADAGEMLRAITRREGSLSRWDGLLRQYARMQRELAAQSDALVALGVPDRRLEHLPAAFSRLLDDTDALLIGQENGLSAAAYGQLRAFLPHLDALCGAVASFGIPATLQHDDFHTNNVGFQDGQYRIFDWGESAAAHPFGSLLIIQREAKFLHGADEAVLDHLRDVYLEAWTDVLPLAQLRECVALTHRLAALGRALSWWHVNAQPDAHFRLEGADATPYWLLACLNNTPLLL